MSYLPSDEIIMHASQCTDHCSLEWYVVERVALEPALFKVQSLFLDTAGNLCHVLSSYHFRLSYSVAASGMLA